MCERKMDNEVFGEDVYVHCDAHGYPHLTGWCTVGVRSKTKLDATTYEDAVKECEQKNLWLYRN